MMRNVCLEQWPLYETPLTKHSLHRQGLFGIQICAGSFTTRVFPDMWPSSSLDDNFERS